MNIQHKITTYIQSLSQLSSALITGLNISNQKALQLTQQWQEGKSQMMIYCWKNKFQNREIRKVEEWIPAHNDLHKPLKPLNCGFYQMEHKDVNATILYTPFDTVIIGDVVQAQQVSNIILSSLSLSTAINYLHLCLKNSHIIPIITTIPLWKQLSILIRNVWGQSMVGLFSKHCRIVKLGETYPVFEGVHMYLKSRYWYEYSYDVILLIGGKQYFIQGYGLEQDDKILYAAYKQNLMSEQQYSNFVDNTHHEKRVRVKGIVRIEQNFQRYRPTLREKVKEVELFLGLDEALIEQICEMGEIRQFTQHQVIYQHHTQLIKIYIILTGQCKAGISVLKEGQVFGWQAFLLSEKKVKQTLQCSSKQCEVLQLQVQILKHLLGHHFRTLQKFKLIDLPLQTTKPIFWYILMVSICSHEINCCPIRFPDSKIKSIPHPLWQCVCRKSLQYLF